LEKENDNVPRLSFTIGRSRGTDRSVVTLVPTSFEPQDVVNEENAETQRRDGLCIGIGKIQKKRKNNFEKFIIIEMNNKILCVPLSFFFSSFRERINRNTKK
jgi:hypothetical protein